MGERITTGLYSFETVDGHVEAYIQKGKVRKGADILNASRLPDEPLEEFASPQERFEQFLDRFETASEPTINDYRRKWDRSNQDYGDDHFMSPLPRDLDRGFPFVTKVTNALFRA